jgi:hypothetical protein
LISYSQNVAQVLTAPYKHIAKIVSDLKDTLLKVLSMQRLKYERIRQEVRERYAEKATAGAAGGCCMPSFCSGRVNNSTPANYSTGLGYSSDDLSTVPVGANMDLGCGNPQAIAALKAGLESMLESAGFTNVRITS